MGPPTCPKWCVKSDYDVTGLLVGKCAAVLYTVGVMLRQRKVYIVSLLDLGPNYGRMCLCIVTDIEAWQNSNTQHNNVSSLHIRNTPAFVGWHFEPLPQDAWIARAEPGEMAIIYYVWLLLCRYIRKNTMMTHLHFNLNSSNLSNLITITPPT